MTYRIEAKARDGYTRPVHFQPDTLEACAGAMAALSCGDRRHARHALSGAAGCSRSYTASNRAGDMLTARWIADTRGEAIRDAQQRGLWPMPRRRTA